MTSTLVDLNAQKDAAIQRADEILRRAESQKRPLSHIEDGLVRQHTREAENLNAEIQRIQSKSVTTFRTEVDALRDSIPRTSFAPIQGGKERILPKAFLAEYHAGFFDYMGRRGISAALSEGTDAAGGYAVPIVVDEQILPFAPASKAIRRLATVVPTIQDRKIPGTSTLPTAAIKTEGSGFSVSDPAYRQSTLSAFFISFQTNSSMEIIQDVPLWNATQLRDGTEGLETLEETKFLTGSGTGEPQGLLGNVGAGVTGAVADGVGNLLSVDATFDVVSTLKDAYHDNATFLMQRTTALALRRAQVQTGLFEPVFRRENGVDLLHGYPVAYSASMPSVAAGNTPVLFGDFRAAYIVGDRGGSAVRLKIIDQDASQAVYGIYPMLIYRRVDGRVRIPEAVQGITLHT